MNTHTIIDDKCEVCSAEKYFILKSFEGKNDKTYILSLYPDGVLMMHEVDKDGHKCSGSLIGKLKSCPCCERDF